MTEVSQNSDGGAVLSRDTGEARSFDLHSWQGLTELLKVARESGLEDKVYADFRDVVLRYAQSGGDQDLKKQIDEVITTFNKPKVAKKESAPVVQNLNDAEQKPEENTSANVEQQPKKTQGMSRPVPSFGGAIQSAPKASEQSNEAPKEPAKKAEPPANLPTVETYVAPEAKKEPAAVKNVVVQQVPEPVVAKTQAPTPQAVEVPVPAPKPEPVPTPVPEAVEPPIQESVEEPKESQPIAAEISYTASGKTINDHKERIAEIKHDVNEKVGNPVMLIDAGNEVGRDYMNALLGAMKATSGGAAGALDSAMQQLEDAYSKIIEHSENAHVAGAVAEVTPPVTEETQAPQKPQAAPAAPETVPQKQAEPAEVAAPASNAEVTVAPIPTIPTPAAEPQSEPVPPVEQPKQDPIPAPATPPPVERVVLEAQSPEERKLESDAAAKEEIKDAPKQSTLSSLKAAFHLKKDDKKPGVNEAIEEKLHKAVASEPKTAQRSDSKQPSTPGVEKDEPFGLYQTKNKFIQPSDVPDIDASIDHIHKESVTPQTEEAFERLLNEWSIFKSSGLLGMGPHGREHPLFMTLESLPMSAVMAGNWDNAKATDIKIIKDYVNAWRHEQGIAFIPSETFTEYLHRVVGRIVERQNAST